MKLERLLFLDFQTTGIRPPLAHIIESAWAVMDGPDIVQLQSHQVQLPEEYSLPKRVAEITGLTKADLAQGLTFVELSNHWSATIERYSPQACVAHYAQFEKPFLLDLYQRGLRLKELDLPILCTHQLSKRLLPDLPSQNIRAAAGFFGPAIVGPNRAKTHVQATIQIWKGLCIELNKRDLKTLSDLQDFLQTKPQRKKSSGYAYRFERLKRLSLPDQPGIYRMLDKTGRVLYVGKATSLNDRVNSYFRGKKGREPRKLEMMAQVWDIQVTPVASPLEAALLESDEIKNLNPPYNVALKIGQRKLIFYSRDFLA